MTLKDFLCHPGSEKTLKSSAKELEFVFANGCSRFREDCVSRDCGVAELDYDVCYRRFIRRCKQGVLQFVILKPVLVLAAFILYYFHMYEDGSFSARGGYLYITLIYTVSYSAALGSLVLFYVACKDLLMPFRALPKFVLVKSVVFLTYWQVSL